MTKEKKRVEAKAIKKNRRVKIEVAKEKKRVEVKVLTQKKLNNKTAKNIEIVLEKA